MATVTVRNGIDVQALLDTIGAIKAKPDLARFTFLASTAWDDGMHSTARMGTFIHAGMENVLANGVPVSTSIEVLS